MIRKSCHSIYLGTFDGKILHRVKEQKSFHKHLFKIHLLGRSNTTGSVTTEGGQQDGEIPLIL